MISCINTPIFHIYKAYAYIQLKKYKEALQSTDDAISLDINYVNIVKEVKAKVFVRQAEVLSSQGQYAEALQKYDETTILSDPIFIIQIRLIYILNGKNILR